VRTPRAPRPDDRTGRAEAGFTFIEILIVMGIISVLVGMVVLALKIWGEKKPQVETRERAHRITGLLDGWRMTFDGMYPPTKLMDLVKVAGGGAKQPKKVDNTDNEGIETVYQALYYPGFSTDPNLQDNELANADEDKLPEAINPQRGALLMEIVDGYGRPFFYFDSASYTAAYATPPRYRTKDGEDLYPKPWKGENGFEQPNSFQLFSAGEDGEPNTDDDIKGWTSK
jgi:prepilin-type N-terminal cleavage/methylation domain-containing protein